MEQNQPRPSSHRRRRRSPLIKKPTQATHHTSKTEHGTTTLTRLPLWDAAALKQHPNKPKIALKHTTMCTVIITACILTLVSALAVAAGTVPGNSSGVPHGVAEAARAAERHRLAKMDESDTPHLQALLQDLWHWRTQDSPEFATMVGLNDNTAGRLDSFTEDHATARKKQCSEFLERAEQLKESALNFEDQVNLKILKYYLGSYIRNAQYRRLLAPISRLEGPHASFPRLVQEQMVLSSYDDFQKLLSRYGGFPRQVQELITLLRGNIAGGTVPPLPAMEGVLERLASFAVSVTESEFFRPFVDLPLSITTVQRRTLRQQAQERVAQDLLPAYSSLQQFLMESYLPHSRPHSSIGSVDGGPALYEASLRYHTTTDLTPDQIHALGVAELRRVLPLLREAVQATGLSVPTNSTTPAAMGLLMDAVRAEPGRYFDNADDLVQAFQNALVDVVDSHVTQAVDIIPKSELRIRGSRTPLSRRVLYESSSLDAARHAVITVDTSDLTLIARDEVTALSLYSGVPGRHMLAEYLRTSTGVPTYRRVLGDVRCSDAPAKLPVYSSFVEGWSLYGQLLGEELDMYPDARQRVGRQSLEALHAALMVVDTGIHHLGWAETKAEEFLFQNTPLSSTAIKNELRRVITWPGLASSAKVGEIKLKELRQKALNALGELFKLQDFHSVALKCTGPITLLQLCVDHYIDVTRQEATSRSEREMEQEAKQRAAKEDSLAAENVPPDYNSASAFKYQATGTCFNISYLQTLLLLALVLVSNVAVIV